MKYLTKKWCALGRSIYMAEDLIQTDRADVYDEALYQKIYNEKEAEMIESITTTYEEYPHIDTIRERFGDPIDIDKCKVLFKKMLEMDQTSDKLSIPEEVYGRIADPRLLALGYATNEIIEALFKVGRENSRRVDEIVELYKKARISQLIPPEIEEKYHFHDCEVVSMEITNDIVIHLDNSCGYPAYNTIIFRDADLLKLDGDIVGADLLYEELYKTSNGYEAHLLFCNKWNCDLIVRCRDIEII